MSDKSPLLSLPYIQPAQAQKHVTHNEALSILDAVAQLAVISRNLSLPPAAPAEGDRHIVASSASGAWVGQEGGIALFDAGDWSFLRPLEGWRAFVLDECVMVTYRDAAWQDDADLRYLISELGVNAMPDPINRLSVSAAATLLNHEGGGHQLKINKANGGATASLLYQSGWVGHAEIGLSADNNLSIKTSTNGSDWTVAMRFEAESGAATGSAIQSNALDGASGRLMAVGAFGLGDLSTGVAAPGDDADQCLAAGFYSFTAAASNCPVVDPSGGSLVVLRSGIDSARQLFVSESGERLWCRGFASGAWQSWTELMTQASVVGTVSENAGAVTGAVVESGENGNGEYVRWADGTQICTNSNAAITTNPASFSGTVTSIDGDKLRIGRWF